MVPIEVLRFGQRFVRLQTQDRESKFRSMRLQRVEDPPSRAASACRFRHPHSLDRSHARCKLLHGPTADRLTIEASDQERSERWCQLARIGGDRVGRVEAALEALCQLGVVLVQTPTGVSTGRILLLYSANKLGWSKRIKGTDDDWPLSPRVFKKSLKKVGFDARIIGFEYSWRRLPPPVQDILHRLASPLGRMPVLKYVGHTFMAVGVKSNP